MTIWSAVQELTRRHVLDITLVDGVCEFGARLYCTAPPRVVLVSALWAGSALVYFAAYYYFIAKATRQLRKRLYQHFRMANQILQLEVRAAKGPTCMRMCFVFQFMNSGS